MMVCFNYRENMLKVDIFFEDLSYTKIVQRESFKLLSLFGEIGGFLGLLLGASILTVCELVDYLFLLTVAKMRSRDEN